jgi:hypothetical protein
VGRDREGSDDYHLVSEQAYEVVMEALERALCFDPEDDLGDPDGDPVETNCDESPFYEPPVPPSSCI